MLSRACLAPVSAASGDSSHPKLNPDGGACYNAAADLIATHPEQLGSEYNFRRLKPCDLFSKCFPPICPMPVYLINLLL